MAVAAFLEQRTNPSDDEIDAAITNICRCGTFARACAARFMRSRTLREVVMGKWTRRAFIGTGTLVGGGFVLGVAGAALAPSRHSVVSDGAAEKGELTTWITVTPDNLVTVLVPHCEMGQGSQTALAMMAAEEMEAQWGTRAGQGSARPRCLCERLPGACVHGRCDPDAVGPRIRLRHVPSRALVRTSGDRRFDGGAWHRALRYARGRRCGQGDADRRGRGTFRRQPLRLPCKEFAHHARGVWSKRQLR